MSKVTIVLLVILAVLIIASIALYFFGKKAEKKQAAQQEQLDAGSTDRIHADHRQRQDETARCRFPTDRYR